MAFTRHYHLNNGGTNLTSNQIAGVTTTPINAVPSITVPFYMALDATNLNGKYEEVEVTGKTATNVNHAATTYAHTTAEEVRFPFVKTEADAISAELATPTVIQAAATVKSGMTIDATWSEFTTTSVQPTYVDVTGCSVASLVIPATSDVTVELMIDYIRNSAAGSGQNLIQILRDSTVVGGPFYVAQNVVNYNQSVLFKAFEEDLGAGTYTYKVQVANNAAGTLTFGSGKLVVTYHAAGV